MDWHGPSGRLVTVSHDRNAFVWAYDPTATSPTAAGGAGGAGAGAGGSAPPDSARSVGASGGGGGGVGAWKPTVVILRINRAALDVKWAPDGRKFAVASW